VAIPTGGTVEIANGTHNWTGSLPINKALHLRGQSKGGVKIIASDARLNVIDVIESVTDNIEISNLDCDYAKAADVWPYMIRVSPSSPASGRCFPRSRLAHGLSISL
jgi:hypothetical protein